jgi:hypothetical protein
MSVARIGPLVVPLPQTLKPYTMKYLILPALVGGLLLTSCGTQPGDATEKTNEQLQENKKEMTDARAEGTEEWREERTEAVKELRDLRATLEERQLREQKRLNDGIKDEEKRAETQAVVTELGTNIARIDATLAKMDASTGADWSRVRSEARQTADETKSWWDRQKELIDRKTDADNDRDGH